MVLFGVISCLSASAQTENGSRSKTSLNSGWKFFKGKVDGTKLRFNETAEWTAVSVPHTWNAEDAFDDEPGYYRGEGWYVRSLDVRQGRQDGRRFLYFEGVNHTAEVFVNGKNAGGHYGGYTAFVFDVTDLLEPGKTNTIAVRVDNTLDRNEPPIDGDFTMYGGIYRDVWLIETSDVHFTMADHASPGIRIDTPRVTAANATVAVSGELENRSEKGSVKIVSTIVDPERKVVGKREINIAANNQGRTAFRLPVIEIASPRLWSPNTPNLYEVRTSIVADGREVDSVSLPLGLRWFRFDADKGFFLNGKHLSLRGTNRHQDRAGLGNALPDELQVKDLEIIKANGFNFLRLAHYPQDPAVLAAADRLGLLIWEEIPIVNKIHVSDEFDERAKKMLREMIRQHRHHPSIVLWGYMNEVFLPMPKLESEIKATVALARELEAICKEEDPGLFTAIAFDHGARELYHTSGLSSVTDVVGWNLYHGWYYETFDDLGTFMDDQKRRYPNRPLILSEYGVNGDRRVHSEKAVRYDSSIQWQQRFHESYLAQLNSRPFIAGSAIWNQFDFGSEFRGETIPHVNQKGLYTYDRQAKDIAHFYRASLSNEPVLHIAIRDQPQTSGPLDRKIKIYSNFDQVSLYHNGVSLGSKTIGALRFAVWDVSLANGTNRFVAKAVRAEREFVDVAHIEYFPFNADSGLIAVNVGSHAEFVSGEASPWAADKQFSMGSWGYSGEGAKSIETRSNVKGTDEEPLFQRMLEGLNSYRFDVPAGEYEIELLFAEPKYSEPGKRVFDISINGKQIVSGLDLARAVGKLSAYRLKARAEVLNNGLDIGFAAKIDETILSGVRVRRVH